MKIIMADNKNREVSKEELDAVSGGYRGKVEFDKTLDTKA